MDTAAVGAGRAAQGLAVHRDRCPHRARRRVFVLVGGAGGVRTGGESAADRCVEGVAVDALQYPAHGRLTGGPVGPVRIAQRGPAVEKELVRGVSGPLCDGAEGLAPARTAQAARARTYDSGWRRPLRRRGSGRRRSRSSRPGRSSGRAGSEPASWPSPAGMGDDDAAGNGLPLW